MASPDPHNQEVNQVSWAISAGPRRPPWLHCFCLLLELAWPDSLPLCPAAASAVCTCPVVCLCGAAGWLLEWGVRLGVERSAPLHGLW